MRKVLHLLDPKDCNYYYMRISENTRRQENLSAGGSQPPLNQQVIEVELNQKQEKRVCNKLMKYGDLNNVVQDFVLVPEDDIKHFLNVVPRIELTTHIYLIRQAGTPFYKVGRSKNPAKRLSQLQTGNPRKLTLVCQVVVRIHYLTNGEQMVRDKLKDYEVACGGGTEWFKLVNKDKVNEAKAAMKELERNAGDFVEFTKSRKTAH